MGCYESESTMRGKATWSGLARTGSVIGMISLILGAWGRAAEAQVTFASPGFTAETVVTLAPFRPVGIAPGPGGRMFVWQRDGVVRIVKDGVLLATPFVDIRSQVNQYGDRGLLGVAVDPDFQTSGHVYLLYTNETGGNPNDSGPKTARLTRVQADPVTQNVALPGSETEILGGLPSEATAHTIGTVRFAPDGTLFVGVGDGAPYAEPDSRALRAQNLASPSGKILRIKPDGSAPSTNPFYDGTDSVPSRVWVYGLRNPFRFALHPITAEPYIGDVGWNSWDEVNRGSAGRNFGWPCWEGPNPQPEYRNAFPSQCQSVTATAPLYSYGRAVGAAAVAGTFYTGQVYPEQYRGNLFIADYTAGWIRRLVLDASGNFQSVLGFAAGTAGPVAVEEGPDGLLYYVEFNTGRVVRVRYNGPVARATATPTSGYSPLTVAFSSAGSVAPEGGALTYQWDFGDGGSPSPAANPSHTYTVTGVRTFVVTLTVTAEGGATGSTLVPVTVGSRPPVATISAPADGTAVSIGGTVVFAGGAADPDDGALGPAALEWTVLLHHNTHVHPVLTRTGAGGSFVVVDHGAGSFAYEIALTATDTSGLTDRQSVRLPVAPTVTAVRVSPNPVVGGTSASGSVTLSQAAPAGGAVISLSSAKSLLQVPSSVTVPAGASTAGFAITTSAVSSPVAVTVTATFNGLAQTSVTLTPPPKVAGFTFALSTVAGGTLSSGTVTLSAPAPSGGVVVALTSNNAVVQVPASVRVSAHSTAARFVATTSVVAETVEATVTASLNGSIQRTLIVSNTAIGAAFRFTYANRTALLGAGWDFVARTAAGGTRNTEQAGSLAVNYDQGAHPGTIRIPLGVGEVWETLNNSQNTLFRTLPRDWTSIRLRIAAFNPVADYQQVGLLAYQDDNNYVLLNRGWVGGSLVELFGETSGVVAAKGGQVVLSNAGNLILRLDRAAATNTFTAFYSTNEGVSWTAVPGSVTKALTNPRLAIQVGADTTGTIPAADLSWVEILEPGSPAPSPPPTGGASNAGAPGGSPERAATGQQPRERRDR